MKLCPFCNAPEDKPHTTSCPTRNDKMQSGDPVYRDARPRSFQVGLEFQDYVCAQLAREHIVLQNLGSKLYQLQVGENLQGFEIKYDERCTDTGRLSIEVAEKSRDDPALPWTASGIARSDNTWLYIQGNRDIIFIFAKSWLLQYYTTAQPEITEKFGTIRTFYVPFTDAELGAARVLRPKASRSTKGIPLSVPQPQWAYADQVSQLT